MATTDLGLIPLKTVAGIFKVHPATLQRWLRDPAMEFPRPIRVGGRLYYRGLGDLSAWLDQQHEASSERI